MVKLSAAVIDVSGRQVRVTSPDRVVFEATTRTPAITKLMLCEYFATVSGAFLRVHQDRPVALERWPQGWREGLSLSADAPGSRAAGGFYSKRLPQGAPRWVTTCQVTTATGRRIDELCISEPATAVWAAQMGTLAFHPWAVRAADPEHPDELRIDLDPQVGANFRDARQVAATARQLLQELGMRGFAKTSGNRGIHIYLRVQTRWSFEQMRHAAIGFGRELERRDARVTTAWWKEQRPSGSVFVDFNQNLRDRTVAGAWSVRSRAGAPVSTPLDWDDLAALEDPLELNVVTAATLLARGDPWQDLDVQAFSLQPLLDLWESLPGGELNFPPEYPKVAGEPPRV